MIICVFLPPLLFYLFLQPVYDAEKDSTEVEATTTTPTTTATTSTSILSRPSPNAPFHTHANLDMGDISGLDNQLEGAPQVEVVGKPVQSCCLIS